jgi:hypothetical protein
MPKKVVSCEISRAPCALRREPLGLDDDRVDLSAAIRAAERRDDAERARVIAAFGDLHVSVVTRGGQQAWSARVVQIGRGFLGVPGGSRRLREVPGRAVQFVA